MYTKEQSEQIEQIIARFKFDKVQKLYAHMNWTWAQHDGSPDRVPTVEELENTARHLFSVIGEDRNDKMGHSDCGTGGLVAYKFPWGFKLTFEASQSKNF